MTLNDSRFKSGLSKVKRAVLSISSLLAVVLICSVALNIALARKVKNLKSVVVSYQAEGTLAVGASVPPIEVKDLKGTPASITYSGSSAATVLYIFKPECPWCARNLPNIKALAGHANGQYRVISLSLSNDGLNDYVVQSGLNMPVYGNLPDIARTTYKLGGTPQTIVISPEGKVLKNWKGAYQGNTQREIERYFNVQLPGLAEVKRPSS